MLEITLISAAPIPGLCPKSKSGAHRRVRLQANEVGCLYCLRPAQQVDPTPAQKYDLMVASGVSPSEARQATGHVPVGKRAPRPTKQGAQTQESAGAA